ncbi:MAG: hypothetical protein CMC19_04945 [Flavobacteriaceae bacterium]|nr:hypothetical protein [Flavobacteriaceae bacterium]
MKTSFYTLCLSSILLLISCQQNKPSTIEKIKEEEVLTALDELFEIVDKDINRIDDIVTEDYFIFENSRKYSTEEFVEYVKSFGEFESKRDFANIEIDTDLNSAHLSMNHHGEFDLQSESGKIRMIYDWIESAYLVKSDNKLKFKFFFSEVTYDTIIPLD